MNKEIQSAHWETASSLHIHMDAPTIKHSYTPLKYVSEHLGAARLDAFGQVLQELSQGDDSPWFKC